MSECKDCGLTRNEGGRKVARAIVLGLRRARLSVMMYCAGENTQLVGPPSCMRLSPLSPHWPLESFGLIDITLHQLTLHQTPHISSLSSLSHHRLEKGGATLHTQRKDVG